MSNNYFGITALESTDFYKTGHIYQYPKGTEEVYSNGTFRGDKWASNLVLPDFDHKIVWFGLQAIIQWLFVDFWNETFFNQPKNEILADYQALMDETLGVGSVKTDHIAALHDLGYLPIRIKELPEGSRVGLRVPCFTIVNTKPEFFWLTNFLETQLSAEVWKPVTVATLSREFRRLFDKYAELTGTDPSFVPWQGHDFSARGMSGIFDSPHCAAGHLLSFTGTDVVSSINYIKKFYSPTGFIGGSVAATEHSVMCLGGEGNQELVTFKRLITEVYPKGIVSIVSDTWDFWQVINEYAKTLKPEILARTGKVVFRPDSGDPVKIICGYYYAEPDDVIVNDTEAVIIDNKYYEVIPDSSDTGWHTGKELSWTEIKGAVECLWDIFGGTTTNKGYKLLDSHVGLIYGDSITLDRAQRILVRLEEQGYASGNIVFGIGSFTYNCLTRDTFGFAIKSTSGVISGQRKEIYKQPKTDDGLKNSACGLIRVEQDSEGEFILLDRQSIEEEKLGKLITIFEDGEVFNHQNLIYIRGRLNVAI